jgi:hypothetical protein
MDCKDVAFTTVLIIASPTVRLLVNFKLSLFQLAPDS